MTGEHRLLACPFRLPAETRLPEECGFGHNVRADGTFRKISNRKPKFDDA
jgi:hypothetical protein